jgi:endo-1,4-beta-xylanase
VTGKALENGMYLRCHALVWHSQLAPWVEAKTDWTPEELRKVIVDHITAVAGHYKGKCYAWDVVNEVLEEDGSYRNSVFYRVLGEEYIKLAFETTAKVDPGTKLYINDYNLEWPHAKTEGTQRIVKWLKDEGVRVDGVGLQAHLITEGAPTIDQHIDAIRGFTKLGVEVALTELDIRMTMPATPEKLALQKEAYKNVSLSSRLSSARANSPRLSVPASRSAAASASPSGTFMTPSAGFPMFSTARARRCCGLRTSPSTPPTTAWSRL